MPSPSIRGALNNRRLSRGRVGRTLALMALGVALAAAVPPGPADEGPAIVAPAPFTGLDCQSGGDDFQAQATWGAMLSNGSCSAYSEFTGSATFDSQLSDPAGGVVLNDPEGFRQVNWEHVEHYYGAPYGGFVGYERVAAGSGTSSLPTDAIAVRFASFWGWCDEDETDDAACADYSWAQYLATEITEWAHLEPVLCVPNPAAATDMCPELTGTGTDFATTPISQLPQPVAASAFQWNPTDPGPG